MDDNINLDKMGLDLEDTDVKILNFLVNDCRTSYAEISRDVHLSRMSVRDRVIKLIDNGIIEKFTLRLNSRKIGLKASVFLNIQTNPNQLEQVVKELMAHPNIESVYGVTGAFALHVHAFLKDISKMEEFLEDMYKIRGITEIQFGIMTRRYKSTRLFT
jgi:DNA-binding Lrp family transcriptional regulator